MVIWRRTSPPSPYRRYKSSLAEPTVFNVADTLRVLPFFVSSFALSSRHGDRCDKIAPVRQIRTGIDSLLTKLEIYFLLSPIFISNTRTFTYVFDSFNIILIFATNTIQHDLLYIYVLNLAPLSYLYDTHAPHMC